MDKIKATYRSCRGVAQCDRCDNDPDKNILFAAYKRLGDAEEAERQVYEDLFREELELQNEKYRKKGNYGRIWTMDEWRKSVRHRPIASVLRAGNGKVFLTAKALKDVYSQFYKWRMKNFRDNLVFVSATIYTGNGAHIHEKYILYWTDEDGVEHTGIDAALEQAGIGLPFVECKKGRYNNRKMLFDRICREKWLDLVEESLSTCSGVELERPDPEYRMRIGINREFRLQFGYERAMHNAAGRANKKMWELKEKIEELEKEREMLVEEIDAKCAAPDEMEKLEERLRVVTGKLKELKKRKEKAEEKYEAIRKTMGY